MGIKSPDTETMKRLWELTMNLVAMAQPNWVDYYKEQWVFDTGATAPITNNDWYMCNLHPR
jgi:hypothetical protein